MTNPYRDMCAELVDAILTPNPYNWEDSLHDSANRARVLLAESVAEGPTDEELYELWVQNGFEIDRFARAVLARWGHPKPPSEADQALALLNDCADRLDGAHENAIRRALELLKELERTFHE